MTKSNNCCVQCVKPALPPTAAAAAAAGVWQLRRNRWATLRCKSLQAWLLDNLMLLLLLLLLLLLPGCWQLWHHTRECRHDSWPFDISLLLLLLLLFLQACGSSGTTAGLAVGAKLAGLAADVHAYAVCDSPDYFYAEIDGLLQQLGYTESGGQCLSIDQPACDIMALDR
jgi:hypothetical protein